MWNGPATDSNSVRFTCSGAGAGAGVGLRDIGGDPDFCAYADVEHKSTSVLQTMKMMVFSIAIKQLNVFLQQTESPNSCNL